MKVRLNGRDREIPEGSTVMSVIETAGLPSGKVAVEINGRVVPRTGFHRALLREGDVVEIVHFVGGG